MSREEAVKILEPFKACMFDQHGCPISDAAIALDVAIETLKEQERKTAVWIYVHPIQGDDEGAYLCSQCKIGGYMDTKYCPHCGFKMANSKEA